MWRRRSLGEDCPHLTAEQQEQLHIAVEGNEEQEDMESGHQLLHVSMLQADELPDNRAYLDGCSTVTAFKSKQYLENIRSVKRGVKINCNSGVMRTDEVGDYGTTRFHERVGEEISYHLR